MKKMKWDILGKRVYRWCYHNNPLMCNVSLFKNVQKTLLYFYFYKLNLKSEKFCSMFCRNWCIRHALFINLFVCLTNIFCRILKSITSVSMLTQAEQYNFFITITTASVVLFTILRLQIRQVGNTVGWFPVILDQNRKWRITLTHFNRYTHGLF